MTALALLFLALSAFLGSLILGFLWPQEAKLPSVALKSSLGFGLGAGLVSFLLFFWLRLFGAWSPAFNGVLAAGGLAGIAYVLTGYFRKKRPKRAAAQEEKVVRSIRVKLKSYFAVVAALALLLFLLGFLKFPHGGWDAWAHWNLRARFIFRGGEAWSHAFHPDFWNPLNYPLLTPLTVAAGWGWTGFESFWIPGGIALLFTAATASLLAASLARLAGPGQGFLAALVLLGTPFFLTHGASQYADIPLAFFFLATFVMSALHDLEAGRPVKFLVLAGVFAAFSAWTKNEGLLFILCFFSARLAGKILSAGWRAALRELAWLSLGLLPVLAVVLYAKTRLFPPRTIFGGRGSSYLVETFSDPARYGTILSAFLRTALDFGAWAFPFPLVLLLYLFWIKLRPAGPIRKAGLAVLLTLGLMLGGYFAFYLYTPLDLEFHLITSVNRLFLCLWPSFLFGFFMIARTPEEAILPRVFPKTN